MNLVNEGVLPPDELDDRDERREEQDSARSRETVADIVAEIRAYGAQPPPRCMWLDIADRVEIAARRERDHAIEHATRHAEAVARDNCRDCVHNPNGKNYEGGNAAAMRDIVTALANVILPPRGKADEDGWLAWVRAMQGKARAALAAPQRNCDLYDTQPTMSMAYEAYRKAAMRSYGNGLTGAVPTVKQKPMTYDEWLLAPAAERKGDGGGK